MICIDCDLYNGTSNFTNKYSKEAERSSLGLHNMPPKIYLSQAAKDKDMKAKGAGVICVYAWRQAKPLPCVCGVHAAIALTSAKKCIGAVIAAQTSDGPSPAQRPVQRGDHINHFAVSTVLFAPFT